jgi:hypothetical protein
MGKVYKPSIGTIEQKLAAFDLMRPVYVSIRKLLEQAEAIDADGPALRKLTTGRLRSARAHADNARARVHYHDAMMHAAAASYRYQGASEKLRHVLGLLDDSQGMPRNPDLAVLCALAVAKIAFASGYIAALSDARQATGERGAQGAKTKGDRLKELLRSKAIRLKRERDLKKNEAAIVLELELPNTMKAKADYIERLIGQMFPGEKWDEIHSSGEEPAD